jgi:type IV secretory pathway TraG/TraD family ATPase VirD4
VYYFRSMRWWMILVVVALLCFGIFAPVPAWFGPLSHWLGPSFRVATESFMALFTFPGRWLLGFVWHGFRPFDFFRASLYQYWGGAGLLVNLRSLSGFIVIYSVSYLFWDFVLARFWKIIGRYDPFGPRAYSGRPHILRLLTGISDWWERETKFGQSATGGFASLWGVLATEYQHGDIFLGRPKLIVGGLLRPVGIPTEKHFVTIAGPGSGKSTGGLIPNLCIHPGNVLVIDPKGELATITAARRGAGGGGVRGMGDEVFVLDPYRIVAGWPTASYNVFDEMERVAAYDADRPASYARKVAQALVPSTSSDPYWDDAPRTFITGLLLYIFQGPKEHRNLVRLRTLIMEGDTESYRRVSGGGSKGDAFDALLVMMENAPEGPYRHIIAGSASSLSKMSPNQRGSVLTMAMEHTSFLDVPEIRKISMSSDFLLEDLKTKRISVYLCLPLNAVTGIEQRWLRMFVLLTVDMMTRVNKAPNPPLLLAIDEFPSLGKLDGIEVVAPTMRSQGVRLWVVGQDIEQFEKVYPGSWGGFIGGAEAVQFMGVTHPPTVAYIAERLGQHVVMEQQDMGRGQVRESARERALRDPDQIARMLAKDGQSQIIWRGSKRPLLLKICPYFEYMPWWYYGRDRRFREKWNRWIWRWGKDNIPYVPPKKPPYDPRDPRHPDNKPPDFFPQPKDGKPGKGLLPADPPNLKPEDIVPGTGASWQDAMLKYAGRMDAWAQKVDRKLGDIEKASKPTSAIPDFLLKPPDAGAAKPAPAPRQPPAPAAPDGALGELDGMIGLDEVKDQVRKTMNLVKLGREREKRGMPRIDLTHHLVFTGNPGTGKTTVARIVGRVYKDMGLLKIGHLTEVDRGDLVGKYVGETSAKVKEVVLRAMDGVLFIDEAYSLTISDYKNDYGPEAVATLLKLMEDNRDRLVVIAAGYKEEMDRFINSNPGLKSRFRTFIDFADYEAGDLLKIFMHMGAGAGVRCSMDAQVAVAALMESLERGRKGFGNGRAVRNIFQECLSRQAARLSLRGARVDVTLFEAEDIPRPGEMAFA